MRGWHPYGVSDPAGFAAMGTVETLVHLHDVAGGLGFTWQPDADVVRRTLDRLFPQAPTDEAAWPTMLWATGRGDLPGREPARRSGAGTAPSADAGRQADAVRRSRGPSRGSA